jgi:hypothetical protein
MKTFITISVTLFLLSLSGDVVIGQGMSPPSGTKKDPFHFSFESRSFFNSSGNKFSFFPRGRNSFGFNAPNRYWFSSPAFLFSRQNNLYSGRSPRFDYFNMGPIQTPYPPFYGPPVWQPSPQVDGSGVFVDQWVNRTPSSDSSGQSLSSSSLLKEGMSEEEVMGRLGSPLERNRIAEREVWKYSGYSLIFVGGKLKEWR